MKSKDLHVGMCVAIKDGYSIRRAYVLEIGTKWLWTYSRYHETYKASPKAVAVAKESYNKEQFCPDVVSLQCIISTWKEYTTAQEKIRLEREISAEREQREYEARKERFEKLGLGDKAWMVSDGYVRLSLDTLERLLATSAGPK